MTIQERVLEASRQADRENPARCQINRNVDCFQHTSRVLAILGPPWAYVGKRAGEGQYTPPGFAPRVMTGADGQPHTITGVSHDAITNGVLQFDLLGGGNDGPEPLGQPASPQALEIPSQYHRPGNPPVAYPLSGPATPAPPTPAPPSVSVLPKADAFTFLKALDAFYRADEGLQRTDGLCADPEGVAQWFYQGVIEGKSIEDVKAQIRTSVEWRSKHS
jgi:hypothetical protein